MKHSLILLLVLALFVSITSDAQTKKQGKRKPASGISVSEANLKAIIADIKRLGADSYQYKIRPTHMGGGNDSYATYVVYPKIWGPTNPNATYTVTAQNDSMIAFLATSKKVPGATVTISYDGTGKLISGPTAKGF